MLRRRHHRFAGDGVRVVQREPGDGEQDQSHQTAGRAHPMPLMQVLESERSVFLLRRYGRVCGGAHRSLRVGSTVGIILRMILIDNISATGRTTVDFQQGHARSRWGSRSVPAAVTGAATSLKEVGREQRKGCKRGGGGLDFSRFRRFLAASLVLSCRLMRAKQH